MSLPTVFSRKDVRLMGRKSLGEVYPFLPVFGIKTTLVPLHASGTCPRARQALASLTSGPMTASPALCKRTGRLVWGERLQGPPDRGGGGDLVSQLPQWAQLFRRRLLMLPRCRPPPSPDLLKPGKCNPIRQAKVSSSVPE